MTIARWVCRVAVARRSELSVMSDGASVDAVWWSAPEGVRGDAVRHKTRCLSRGGGGCSCSPSYQAQVWSARDQKPIRRTFDSLAEARAWRQESQVAVRRLTMRAPTSITVAGGGGGVAGRGRRWAGADAFGVAVQAVGASQLRGGAAHEAAARAWASAFVGCVPEFVCRIWLIDWWGRGSRPVRCGTRSCLLRAIYRRALDRGDVAVNPTLKLLVAGAEARPGAGRARATEAAALIAALPLADRGLWATAVYAGLRRGELQALDWSSVDLGQGLIRVERSWDRRAGLIDPKSKSGKRRVPIPEALRSHLLTHRLQQGRGGRGLVFAGRNGRPFDPGSVAARARTAWARAGLEPIGLHDCRHTYAAFMIAAERQRQSTEQLHGPLNNHRHTRPLRAPAPRQSNRKRQRSSIPGSNRRTNTACKEP